MVVRLELAALVKAVSPDAAGSRIGAGSLEMLYLWICCISGYAVSPDIAQNSGSVDADEGTFLMQFKRMDL